MTFSLLTPNQKMLTPEEESALIAEWIEHRDQKTLVTLIRAFSPLVSKFVRKYAAYGISKEDLLSVGNLALIETADRFNPSKGFKFSTYASHWIRGTMLIFIASNYFSFSLKSQKMKHIFFKLRRVMYEQNNRNDGDNDIHAMMDKLSEHFGMSPAKLEQIYDLIQHPNTSMHQPAYSRDSETAEFGDLIPTEEPDPEESLINKQIGPYRQKLLQEAMQEALNERERAIIDGQLLNSKKTLQDFANMFNLSRERVRQIRNMALVKLEKAIRAKCVDIDPKTLY